MAETGDVQIFPTIAIEIRGQYAHAPARVAHSCAVGHIGEGTVAVVVVKHTSGALGIGGSFYSEGIGEVNVEAAVIVVVEQRNATAHGLHNVFLLRSRNMLEVDPRRVGDIYEVRAWTCFGRSKE